MLRLARSAISGALVLAVILLLPTLALADTYSPSIAPANVKVEEPLTRGSRHELPALAVRNGGPEAIAIRMSARPAPDDSAATAAFDATASDWVSFSPEEFVLAPGETRAVEVGLRVPDDAPLGTESLWLRAEIPPPDPGSGVAVHLGVAVASFLEFDVREVEATGGSTRSVALGRSGGVILAAVLAGAASYGLTAFLSRYRLRVVRRDDPRQDRPGGGEPPSA